MKTLSRFTVLLAAVLACAGVVVTADRSDALPSKLTYAAVVGGELRIIEGPEVFGVTAPPLGIAVIDGEAVVGLPRITGFGGTEGPPGVPSPTAPITPGFGCHPDRVFLNRFFYNIVRCSGVTGAVRIALGAGDDFLQAQTTGNTISVEAGDGNDVLDLRNNEGAIYANGADGNDRFAVAGHLVLIVGGPGDDQGVVNDFGTPLDTYYAYGNDGNDIFLGNGTLPTNSGSSTGPQTFVYGGNGDDDLEGGGGIDTFDGEAGNDRLRGGNGPDVLTGGSGVDELIGNGGADRLFSKDGVKDAKVDCGAGSQKHEFAQADVKDHPVSC